MIRAMISSASRVHPTSTHFSITGGSLIDRFAQFVLCFIMQNIYVSFTVLVGAKKKIKLTSADYNDFFGFLLNPPECLWPRKSRLVVEYHGNPDACQF